MSAPCVYCHQGTGPDTGYTRTCPECKRVYLARFPRDEQDRASGEVSPWARIVPRKPALPLFRGCPDTSGERPAEMSNEQHIEHCPVQITSGDRPAEPVDVRQSAAQGRLF